jgi:ABC-type transport system involved in cytochrome bd biosynthesis fused ATPase/permease subunit
VEVDALDVRTAELSALRRRVSRVARPETFEGSLRDNLTLGRDVGVETLREVIDRVGLTGELRELPHGIDTGLNGHGQPLSAGQLARLALARAMLQRPSLLLVDGLLDVLTERELDAIVPALCSAEAPWTLVVASRRREVWRRFPRVVDLSTSRSVPHEAAS